jgi:hypothetical protein
MMPGKHAIFSPSGFKALMLCPAKPAMERGLPDEQRLRRRGHGGALPRVVVPRVPMPADWSAASW